jgi:hypothetical protein
VEENYQIDDFFFTITSFYSVRIMIEIETLSIVFTGLSISLAAFYYIRTLSNAQRNQQLQLETRQAQLYIQMYNNIDDNYLESVNKVFEMEYDDFVDFRDKYGIDSESEMVKHIQRVAYFLEGLGVLVKEDLVSMRLVALTWAGTTRMFWDKISPIIEEWRKAINYPRLWSETEFLCKSLIKYMEEHPELAT